MGRKLVSVLVVLVFLVLGVWPGSGPSEARAADNKVMTGQLGDSDGQGAASGQRSISAKELFDLLAKAAGEGQAPAMYDLAGLYARGVGTPRDFTQALAWYQKAAAADFPAAYYHLGLAYESGQGAAADQKRAVANYQKAVELKVPEAAQRLAVLALAGPTPKDGEQKALDQLEAAGLKPGQAMETLGVWSEQGLGGLPNYTRAFGWYEKAAKAGEATAYLRLGACYEVGLGVAADPQAARANYQKAADLKLPDGAYRLAALSLAEGDQRKMLENLQKAADNGHALAANELGIIYLDGRFGQPPDPDRALAMFRRSAELGNAEAMKNVAVVYRDGRGRKPDPVQALQWYIIARKRGYQPEALGEVIELLKKELTEDQIKKSQAGADQWLAEAAAGQAQARP